MSFLSAASETALRLLIYVHASYEGKTKLNVQEIALATDTPTAYAAKVLQILTRKGLMSSTRGPHGGFYLEEEQAKRLTAYDVIVAMDGTSMFGTCLLGLKDCSASRPCPMHDDFTQIRRRFETALRQTTIHMLAARYATGTCFVTLLATEPK